MIDLAPLNEKIQALMRDNPAMNKWPKHKKKYQKLIAEHGEGYSSKNCKTEDKNFLLFFEELKKIRLEIKALKEQKEFLKNRFNKKIVIEKQIFKSRPSKNRPSKKRQPTKRFTAGLFSSEVQSGIYAKKR